MSAALVLGELVLLVWLERRRPLRSAVESKSRREARNVALSAFTAMALQITERPIVSYVTALVRRRRWGLFQRISFPIWLEVPFAVAWMDYTLYVWHVLLHRLPVLWRFHLVHHVDLDLDTTTALRFHCGEMVISVAWRAGQVFVFGLSQLSLSIWQTALLLSVLFHHSNVMLRIEVERLVNRFIVTPRMHGIHHSIIPEETGSNWSSGLTLWDRLHGTLRLNVPQSQVTIGVPAYQNPGELTFPKLMGMPFRKMRPSWNYQEGGQPIRGELSRSSDYLAP